MTQADPASAANSGRASLSRGKRWVFALIVFVGVLIFAEAAGSVVYYLMVPAERRDVLETAIGVRASDSHAAIRFLPHPYFNYVCNPDYAYPSGVKPHNSRGFRLPEWPETRQAGVVRIAAVGGSTTYGMHFEDYERTWPAILAELLRAELGVPVEVLNFGVPNYTPHEAIGVVAMLMPALEPDYVLMHFGGNNAFTACYPDEGGPDNTRFHFAWTHRPVPGFARTSMRASRLARLIGYGALARGGYLPGELTRTMQYPHPDDDEAAANARKATGKHFRQAMRSLVALTENAGAVPVLLTQPLDPTWDYTSSIFYSAVIDAHRRNNRIIDEVGREYDVPVIDLYAAMRQPVLFQDALHSSEAGMREKAALIAEPLAEMVRKAQSAAPSSHDGP